MGFIEALLLISINFSNGMMAVSDIDIHQEVVKPTIIQNQTYQETDRNDIIDSYCRYEHLKLPDYPDSAEPVFVKGEGTEFSITWEHTININSSDDKGKIQQFYDQLSDKLGYHIDRYKSFNGCWGSASYGKSTNYKRQRYRDAKVSGGFVIECIDDGQMKSISGTFDTKIDEVPYMEPVVTEDKATDAVISKYKIDPEKRGVTNHGLWIDREYVSPVNKNNKLYYLIEVYNVNGNKWYRVDAQKPVVIEDYNDYDHIY